MLFDSSLRKELGRGFSATVVVLVTIVMTVMLIRTLGQATDGRVGPSDVLLVMGYTVLGQLPTILTVSLFIAVTVTLARMYAASEMVVWFASGQPLSAFAGPMLRFAWPVVLVIALLSLLAVPWSNWQIRQLRDRYQGRSDLERVAPGQFIESANGQRVFFIDKSPDADKDKSQAGAGETGDDPAIPQTGSNIFIISTLPGKETVTSARAGHLEQQPGGRFLVLNNGQQLETERTQEQRMRISEFAEYGARVSASSGGASANNAPRYKTTLALLADPSPPNHGELSWRLGLILAAINCVLFGLASTKVNPRVGRSAGVIFALLAFFAYYNLLTIGQSWIGRGRVGLWPYLLLLHGGIFLLSLVWLALRQGWWPGRRGQAAPAAAQGEGA